MTMMVSSVQVKSATCKLINGMIAVKMRGINLNAHHYGTRG
jgi:hypothetical protein